MKTEAPAPAANLTVAQLGQALTKPATDPKSEAKPAATVTSREPLPGPKTEGDEVEPDETVLSKTETESRDGREGSEGEAEETEGAEGAETESTERETEPEGAEAEGEKPEAPVSVGAAVAERLNQELGPLIEELTKAGAKGALQILQKRIPKLVDQRDTERNKRLASDERAATLEAELDAAKNAKPEARSQSSPTHPAVAKLNQGIAEVDTFIKLFRGNPNGVELDDGEGGKVNLDADQVAEHLDKLRDKRTELVAQKSVTEQQVKAAFQQTFQQVRQQAAKVYPWLNDANAPEQARLKKILQAIPGLKENADHELIVARYFRGMKAEADELAKGKAPVVKKAPAAKEPTKVGTDTPSGKAAPLDEKGKAKAEVKAAEEQFRKSGKKADMDKLEAAKRKLSRLG